MNDRFRFRIPMYSEYEERFTQFIYTDVYHEPLGFIGAAIFKTPEQCTGLKDKNGKLIYEGDIVRRTRNTDRATVNLQIEWNQRSGRYLTTDAKHRDWNFSMLSYEYEVIGNIHENPELLEDK